MSLMVKKDVRDRICHSIHQYVEANNKYMKNDYENKESSYLIYWDINNFHRRSTSQKGRVEGLSRLKKHSSLMKIL